MHDDDDRDDRDYYDEAELVNNYQYTGRHDLGDLEEHVRQVEEFASRQLGRAAKRGSMGQSNLGRTIDFQPNPNANTEAIPLRPTFVQARAPKPVAWLISLSVGDIPAAVGGGAVQTHLTQGQAFASLNWGTGGANHVARVDWRKGSAFVLYGDMVTVRGEVNWEAGQSAGLQPLKLRATATPCRWGSPQNLTPPTLTVTTGVLQAGTRTGRIVIPPYAQRVWHAFDGGNTLSRQIQFQREQGVVDTQDYNYPGGTSRAVGDFNGVGYPIPRSAHTLQFINTSASAMTSIDIVFELSLA